MATKIINGKVYTFKGMAAGKWKKKMFHQLKMEYTSVRSFPTKTVDGKKSDASDFYVYGKGRSPNYL